MNNYNICSLWLVSGRHFTDEIECTFDLEHILKIWDLLLSKGNDLIQENRKVVTIELL